MKAGSSYGRSLPQRIRNAPPVVYVIAGGGGVYYVYHLERTETGRLRFMDTSEISERQMGDAVLLFLYLRQLTLISLAGYARDLATVFRQDPT